MSGERKRTDDDEDDDDNADDEDEIDAVDVGATAVDSSASSGGGISEPSSSLTCVAGTGAGTDVGAEEVSDASLVVARC